MILENPDTRQNTKKRILDAAEHLFARKGFHNASLRSITRSAGVNLAAIGYHFGSKEGLMEAVLERRLKHINDLRLQRLTAVKEASDDSSNRPDLEEVLRAFIEPALRFRTAPGSKDFITLVGRALVEPDDKIRRLFMEMIRPVFLLFFETLSESVPEIPKGSLLIRVQFAMGAMGHTMCMGTKFPLVPEGVVPEGTGINSLIDMLVSFAAKGIRDS